MNDLEKEISNQMLQGRVRFCGARKRRLLPSRSLGRMAGEILAETCAEFLQARIDVLVHSENDGRNGLVGDRFIVSVGLAPGDTAGRGIVQFEVQREAGDESG